MSENVLEIEHLTKEYKLYSSERDRFKEAFHPLKKKYHRPFYALKDINISIKKGEKVGIIGSNGAGKSTLLKVITEVIEPTEGSLKINGKVAALLELGAGFNQNYTGYENIKLNGMLMGFTAEEMAAKTQQIVDFADIGEFIDQPVKNYSSGMFIRLAFASQIFSEPDILIVDEALSVGDIRFQQKCYRAMESLMEEKTVVLVTHDTAAVTRFCNRVIWLNHGQVMFDGDTEEGLRLYQEHLIEQTSESNDNIYFDDKEADVEADQAGLSDIPEIPESMKALGNGKARITNGGLYDMNDRLVDVLEPDREYTLKYRVKYKERIERPIIGIQVYDRLGNIMFCINSEMINIQLPAGEGEVEYDLKFTIPRLNQGEYTISMAVANGYQVEHAQLCWIDEAVVFRVAQRQFNLPGFFYLDQGTIEIHK